jgi:hypothetical protein
MNNEARCAFVQAQVACAMAEIAAMQARNQQLADEGVGPHFTYDHFMEVQNKYLIGHNAVIEYLRDG